MTLVFTLLTMVVLGLVSAVAVGRLGGGLDAPVSSLPSRGLPEGDVTDTDIEAIRFAPALRGYRMDEVDAVVDRLVQQLRSRDAELEQLRREIAQRAPQHGAAFWEADGQRPYTDPTVELPTWSSGSSGSSGLDGGAHASAPAHREES